MKKEHMKFMRNAIESIRFSNCNIYFVMTRNIEFKFIFHNLL